MINNAENLYNLHPISVADYQRMAEAGILDIDTRVELIEGEIIDMVPIGSPHAAIVNRLTRELVRQAENSALVSVQNPIILGDYSEPEPDLVLLKPKANDYQDALPQAEDILLLIEVADSTLNYDRKIKAPLYARFGIFEFWLINLPQQSVTLFQKPLQDQFSIATTLMAPKILTPLLLPHINLDLGQLFK
ncbi:MAG: Uma2 family endonuclease [Methylococcales bacterium]